MKIFRWVLSNLLLLAVVWTFVYAYLNWDELKDDMPDSVNNLVARFQHDESPEAEVSPDESPVTGHGVQSELGAKEPEVVVTEETETVLNQMPVDQNETQTMGEPEAGNVAPLSADQPIVETQEQEAISVQVPEVAQMPAPQQAMKTDQSSQKQELDEAVRAELIQAREAFWNRDLAKAESLYSELTTKQPDYPDLWGEMGNVYLAQNKVKEAADAYYKAAELLIDEGRLRQVGQLMGVIQMADPDKAMILDKKIQGLYQQHKTMR
jgi:tetratricopeptide (TPR) repeat protein